MGWLNNGITHRYLQVCLFTLHGKTLVKVTLNQREKTPGGVAYWTVDGAGNDFKEAFENAKKLAIGSDFENRKK